MDTLVKVKSQFKFTGKRAYVGMTLALAVIIISAIFGQWITGFLYALAFLAIGFINVSIGKNAIKYIILAACAVLVVWATMRAPLALINGGASKLVFVRHLLNAACIVAVCLIVFIITANIKAAIIAGATIMMILATTNGIVYQFRGKEFVPLDILSTATALNVVGEYSLVISWEMSTAWIFWVVSIFATACAPKVPKLPKIRSRIIAFVLSLVITWLLFFGAKDIMIRTWDKTGTVDNGFYLNFFMAARDSFVKKPADYSPDSVEKLAAGYECNCALDEEKRPNVIAIMGESYSDFSVLKEELRTNIPVTPFVDSLTENTIKGYAMSSVFGANTANSEFEFLTGHSMMFLPQNSVPYQQYIRSEIFTLPWLMRSYGYKSIATHPHHANGWSRNVIYNTHLGFEESTFLEDYNVKEKVRKYVGDADMYNFILDKLRNNSENGDGRPLFMFGITMQNHGGYKYNGKRFEKTIELDGYSKDYPQAEQYLSLQNLSDKALEQFLGALEEYPEDTVVLFFGDHFPKIEPEFYEEMNGGPIDEFSEQMLQYKIPFFVWANYDIEEKTVECTSINYLSNYLLEVAGLPHSPYHNFLAELEKEIPAVTALGYYSLSRGEFISHNEVIESETGLLKKYEMIQYNNLFDSKNLSKTFFRRYIDSAKSKGE